MKIARPVNTWLKNHGINPKKAFPSQWKDYKSSPLNSRAQFDFFSAASALGVNLQDCPQWNPSVSQMFADRPPRFDAPAASAATMGRYYAFIFEKYLRTPAVDQLDPVTASENALRFLSETVQADADRAQPEYRSYFADWTNSSRIRTALSAFHGNRLVKSDHLGTFRAAFALYFTEKPTPSLERPTYGRVLADAFEEYFRASLAGPPNESFPARQELSRELAIKGPTFFRLNGQGEPENFGENLRALTADSRRERLDAGTHDGHRIAYEAADAATVIGYRFGLYPFNRLLQGGVPPPT